MGPEHVQVQRRVRVRAGSGRSLGEGNGNPLHYSFLQEEFLQEIPWTEEPGGLQSVGSRESEMTEYT